MKSDIEHRLCDDPYGQKFRGSDNTHSTMFLLHLRGIALRRRLVKFEVRRQKTKINRYEEDLYRVSALPYGTIHLQPTRRLFLCNPVYKQNNNLAELAPI